MNNKVDLSAPGRNPPHTTKRTDRGWVKTLTASALGRVLADLFGKWMGW